MKKSDMTPAELEAARKENISFAIYLVTVVIVCLLFVRFVATKSVVHGSSMEPTLQNKNNLVMERVSYYFRDPDRFDIVIFNTTKATEKRLIKRVIGLPGETVAIHDGSVYINGKLLASDVYAKNGYTSAMDSYKLGPDEYFVLGDNRDNSLDSRIIGAVPRKDIIGRAMLRFWPLNKITVFKRGNKL